MNTKSITFSYKYFFFTFFKIIFLNGFFLIGYFISILFIIHINNNFINYNKICVKGEIKKYLIWRFAARKSSNFAQNLIFKLVFAIDPPSKTKLSSRPSPLVVWAITFDDGDSCGFLLCVVFEPADSPPLVQVFGPSPKAIATNVTQSKNTHSTRSTSTSTSSDRRPDH
jgi:hypothetical protein